MEKNIQINIQELIGLKKSFMLYVGGEYCSACKVLQPKIFDAFDREFPNIDKLSIDIEDQREFAAQQNIFAVPTIIVYFEGKEFFRKSRNLSVDLFIEEVRRPYNIFS